MLTALSHCRLKMVPRPVSPEYVCVRGCAKHAQYASSAHSPGAVHSAASVPLSTVRAVR